MDSPYRLDKSEAARSNDPNLMATQAADRRRGRKGVSKSNSHKRIAHLWRQSRCTIVPMSIHHEGNNLLGRCNDRPVEQSISHGFCYHGFPCYCGHKLHCVRQLKARIVQLTS